MKDKYKEPNKSKGENGYKNNRGLDAFAAMFGGLMQKAINAKHEKKEKAEKKDNDD